MTNDRTFTPSELNVLEAWCVSTAEEASGEHNGDADKLLALAALVRAFREGTKLTDAEILALEPPVSNTYTFTLARRVEAAVLAKLRAGADDAPGGRT